MKTQSLITAFKHAFNGLFHFMRSDKNGKIHFIICLLVTLTGWYVALSITEWVSLLICFALVISLEMCNHAMEKLCDAVHPDKHPLIKIVKDVAAGAVLWSVMLSILIGLLIFIPKILSLL